MGESIIKTLSDLYATQAAYASADANYITGILRTACGIGALIYIFGQLVLQISSNQEINFLPFLRPFVIMLVLPFSGQISTAIDGIGTQIQSRFNAGSKNIAAQVKAVNDQMKKKVDEKWQNIRDDPKAYKAVFGTEKADDESGFFGESLTNMNITIAQAQESFKFQMYALIQELLLALMYVAEAILFLFSIMYRLVLRMGFPIAICLCLFPGFTSNLANWFGKYINFALLPAVAAMYTNICFKILLQYLNNYNASEALAQMGGETAQPEYMGLAFIAILIMCLLGYTQIPSMTAMLVSVGGVGAIAAVASRTATNVANRGIKTGDKLTNSISKSGESFGNIVGGYGKSAITGATVGAIYGKSQETGAIKTAKNIVKGATVGGVLGMVERFQKKGK